MHTQNSPLSADNAVSEQTADSASSDMTEFRLPPMDWEAFCQRLDAPPRTIPALQQLFSETEFH